MLKAGKRESEWRVYRCLKGCTTLLIEKALPKNGGTLKFGNRREKEKCFFNLPWGGADRGRKRRLYRPILRLERGEINE